MGNFNVVIDISAPAWPSTGTWYEFFTQTELSVTSLTQKVNLQPGEYRLYSSVKIEKPDYLNTGIQTPENPNNENFALIYPNPSAGNFSIDVNLANQENVSIQVFDVIGNKLIDFGPVKLQAGIQSISSEQLNSDHLRLSPGLYMVKVKTDNQQQNTKIIVN
jgi:hypothetical protein